MALVITKLDDYIFTLVLDGGDPIVSEQNRLTTFGNYCNFKTANGANLLLRQNILASEVTVISGGTFNYSTALALRQKLIDIGFFATVGSSGGGSGVNRFDELLDTFSYNGRNGQVVYVNEPELKLSTKIVNDFSNFYKDKLDGIEAGAQVNIQSDWDVTDTTSPAYIFNKPVLGISFLESNPTDVTVWNNGKGNISTNTAYGDGALKSNDTGQFITAVGYGALSSSNSGELNTAVGVNTLFSLSTGNNNTVVGSNSASLLGYGDNNSVFGGNAYVSGEGENNTVIGQEAFYNLVTGDNNTVIGDRAGYITTAGPELTEANNGTYIGRYVRAGENSVVNETVVGYAALGHGTNTMTFGNSDIVGNYFTGDIFASSYVVDGFTGARLLLDNGDLVNSNPSLDLKFLSSSDNDPPVWTSLPVEFNTVYKTVWNNGGGDFSGSTSFGDEALISNYAGNFNTAFGFAALKSNTVGMSNTAHGNGALYSNTDGEGNTAISLGALYLNSSGNNNVAVGLNSLYSSTTAGSNTAVGHGALQFVINGDNAALGYNAGKYFDDGITENDGSVNSLYLGSNTKASSFGFEANNETVIGYEAIGNGSNTMTFGNDAVTHNYFSGEVISDSFVKISGTATQVLMADGSTSSILSGTATLNFPATLASTSSDLTITVTGAAIGDVVILGVPDSAVVVDTCYSAWVSATNTVTVRHNNYSGITSNPSVADFKCKIIK